MIELIHFTNPNTAWYLSVDEKPENGGVNSIPTDTSEPFRGYIGWSTEFLARITLKLILLYVPVPLPKVKIWL